MFESTVDSFIKLIKSMIIIRYFELRKRNWLKAFHSRNVKKIIRFFKKRNNCFIKIFI